MSARKIIESEFSSEVEMSPAQQKTLSRISAQCRIDGVSNQEDGSLLVFATYAHNGRAAQFTITTNGEKRDVREDDRFF